MSHEVPGGWKRSQLGDLIKLEYGKALASAQRRDGAIPVFGSSGVVGYHDKAAVIGPSVVLSRKGSLGGVFYVENGFWPIDTTYFVVQKENCDWRWLTYLLQFASLERLNEATGVPGLNRDKAAKEMVAVPPLHEQQRIAEILSSVDDAVAATRAVIEQTEIVKNSAVLDLVQGKDVPGERKPTTGWRIGNFGVSTIPATWKIVHLTSVAKLESGHTPSKKVPEYWDGTINWLSLHDTKNLGKRLIFETEQKTTQLGIDNSSARLLPAGTVCLSRTASIGHCVILGTEMATSQDFANYVCGKEISNVFLMFLFRGMGDVWNQLSSGSTHQTIYMPIFEQLQIILPPLGVQAEIVQAVSSIYDQIDVLKHELAMIEATKSALMSDLLTGRKRVTDALPMAAE